MKRFLSVITVLISLASVSAIAQDFNQGVAAFQTGDYAAALKNWMPLAETDDAEAQRNIGIMYQRGLGVPLSDAEAAKWYRRAADKGHSRAQQNLGALYEVGAGVPQNYSEAVRWYRLSAEQGNITAKVNLGVLYERGVPGLPRDVVRTHMWYNLAAAQGHGDAAQLRDDIAASMTPEQVSEAQRLAQEWLARHTK